MSSIVENSRDGVVIQDIHANILWANPSWCNMFGWSLEEVVGKNPLSFVIPEPERPTPEDVDEFHYDLDSGFLDEYELVRNIRKDGKELWTALSFSHQISENGEDRIVVFCRDVTENVEREEQLKKSTEIAAFRADHDALTSVANRGKFNRFFRETRAASLESGQQFGLLHIDLDHFKSINDTYGHAAGDAVIVKAADRMRAVIGTNGLLARTGGDEFVIVRPNVDGFDMLRTLSEQIIRQVCAPISWEGRTLRVGASVGVALSTPQINDDATMIQNADVALYEAKEMGRGQVACYDREMDRSHFDKTRLASELMEALETDQLDVFLQPQYSLIAKAVTGFEALIRWNHPTKGLLLPKDFLNTATEVGVIEDIDRFAASRALAALKMLNTAGNKGLQIAVNVSSHSIAQTGYLDFMKWEADQHGLETDRIVVEVLESTFFSETDNRAENAIQALSKAGFRVELDDFGTGYAGLSHLGRLRVDGVKIDKSMVNGLANNVTNQIIVQAMVGLCSDLGLQVIAVGVTNRDDAMMLRQFGCINIQGTGISEPMPINEVENWLKTNDMNAVLGIPEKNTTQYQRVVS